MTRIINSELFKLRSTRTFYALLGTALAIVLLPLMKKLSATHSGHADDAAAAAALRTVAVEE